MTPEQIAAAARATGAAVIDAVKGGDPMSKAIARGSAAQWERFALEIEAQARS